MGDTPAVDEIRESEQGESNTDAEEGADGGAGGGDGGGGMFGGSVPTFGLSRRQLLLIGVLVAVVLAWKLRDSGDGGGSAAAEEVEKARNPDLGDVKVREDDDAEGVEVRIPANPDDELEKDEAVIDLLREGGHIDGGGD